MFVPDLRFLKTISSRLNHSPPPLPSADVPPVPPPPPPRTPAKPAPQTPTPPPPTPISALLVEKKGGPIDVPLVKKLIHWMVLAQKTLVRRICYN